MHHETIDRLAAGASPLHRRDPRAKLAAALAVAVAAAVVPAPAGARLAALAALTLGAALAARLPLGFLGRRLLVVLPFVVPPALLLPLVGPAGWGRAAAALGQALVAASATLVLAATTRMTDLLEALRWLRVPGALVTTTGLLYRYLFVLVDEAERMQRARLARGGRRLGGVRGAGALLGSLLVRAHGRAEAVHRAMLARGLAGEPRPVRALRGDARDVAFAALACALAAACVLAPAPRLP
ncbi:MAG TPA: cobalt ECF transporter T component CbiQ [Polyangia bacterium]